MGFGRTPGLNQILEVLFRVLLKGPFSDFHPVNESTVGYVDGAWWIIRIELESPIMESKRYMAPYCFSKDQVNGTDDTFLALPVP